jgi:hypothetical protein
MGLCLVIGRFSASVTVVEKEMAYTGVPDVSYAETFHVSITVKDAAILGNHLEGD